MVDGCHSSLNLGRCVCASGYYREQTNGTGILPDQTCVACPAGQYASADETFCRTCIQPSDPSLSGTQCTCGVGEYLVDRDAATALPLASATCTPCPIYAYPTRNLTTCIECPQHVMQAVYAADSGTYECVCRGDLGFSETPVGYLSSVPSVGSGIPSRSVKCPSFPNPSHASSSSKTAHASP
ncbi:uncharacterized protein EV422DRAFT_157858 [Fimicolochytrium jonesii]|uniref:uncharacterized protein n=1 Tax=Fimicolochytrium jonesii TaxID=1396493 RepID=UPI0022FEBB59|nr:uncharacterized protein EV422DRAFT_157858 [Fimicolochytrium jonesii]KAI8826205.1 hypothetical protein EV422DRAFT_157858 [Fimicolochytrium jonesii]